MREQLSIAQRNALRLLRLVNSLLDFSRIEAGRTQALYHPTDLAKLTRDLASTFRSAIEVVPVTGFSRGMRAVAGRCYVGREMWERVVLNLLSNAIKFTLSAKCSCACGVKKFECVLDVIDIRRRRGRESLPRLFDFYRVEARRAARRGSRG